MARKNGKKIVPRGSSGSAAGGTKKRPSKTPATSGSTGPRAGARRTGKQALGRQLGLNEYERDYLRLVMDPCNAPLVKSLLPGSHGTIVERIDFRSLVTIPSDGSRRTLVATVVPAQYQQTSFSYLGSTLCMLGDSVTTDMAANSGDAGLITPIQPANTSSLLSIADSARPIAGCLRLRYMGTAAAASGVQFAWEGTNGRVNPVVSHFGSGDNGNWAPTRTANALLMDGVTRGVGEVIEAKFNPSRVGPDSDNFVYAHSSGSPNVSTWLPGELPSGDLANTIVLVVGCSGAPPGQTFEVSGTIVYEIRPKAGGATRRLADTPTENRMQAKSSLSKVVQAIESYGPLLAGTAMDMMSMGPSTWMIRQLGRLKV